MWPNARISVMGGDQAAAVLAEVARPGTDVDALQAETREQYEAQGNPYYSTARLWDDGILEPGDTRAAIGLALAAAANAPLEPVSYGVFRM
jgi:3-methylcrotonyl-CoA carboxylase beta subunit